jgi:prevent-host-death family protein
MYGWYIVRQFSMVSAMRQVSSTDFKSRFGEYADAVRDEPIEVYRGNRPVGVFVSTEEYEHLRHLDDAYWAARARTAVERGEFLTPEETMRWINERLAPAE